MVRQGRTTSIALRGCKVFVEITISTAMADSMMVKEEKGNGFHTHTLADHTIVRQPVNVNRRTQRRCNLIQRLDILEPRSPPTPL